MSFGLVTFCAFQNSISDILKVIIMTSEKSVSTHKNNTSNVRK